MHLIFLFLMVLVYISADLPGPLLCLQRLAVHTERRESRFLKPLGESKIMLSPVGSPGSGAIIADIYGQTGLPGSTFSSLFPVVLKEARVSASFFTDSPHQMA